MPVITPEKPELKALSGLHLWHTGLSTCSQRCRIVMAELGQEFESNVVNLNAGENATDWYQAIHPGGVVPALAHDGKIVIESIDIISYLEKTFGPGSLQPESPEQFELMKELMARSNVHQYKLKTLTFEFLFRVGRQMTTEEASFFQTNLKNESLRKFHRDYRAGNFDKAVIDEAVDFSRETFTYLESLLADGRSYLLGEKFTLADIAWMPNFHRFEILGWSFEPYPALEKWFERVSSRDSYQKGLKDWEPTEMLQAARPKMEARVAAGNGMMSYGRQARSEQ
jgi:glutathione S-transferase